MKREWTVGGKPYLTLSEPPPSFNNIGMPLFAPARHADNVIHCLNLSATQILGYRIGWIVITIRWKL